MLAERVEEWTQQWKEEGLQQGLQQGRAEGRAEVLLRLANKRFGVLTPEQEARLRAADLDQVQERLLSAASFEELLTP